jgi:hypothetical protein
VEFIGILQCVQDDGRSLQPQMQMRRQVRGWVWIGWVDGWVEKRILSAALLTESVSNFSRNDDSFDWAPRRFLCGFESHCGFFGAFDEDICDAGEEQDGQDERVEGGGVVAFFDEPPVVDDSGDGGNVDEAVKSLPAFSAHGAEDEGG